MVTFLSTSLNKRLTEARTDETRARKHTQRTREKMHRLQLAKARGDLIEKKLVTDQAAYLFTAVRQKMLGAPLAWHRKFVGITDPRVAIERLTEMQHSLLAELHDMPKKITDPRWIETLDEDDT
jgi:hypothetical protein